MSKLSISKAWDESKAIAARDGRLIAAVALALILLPQTVAGVIVPPPLLSGEQAPAWGPFLSLLIAGIGVIAQVAITRLALGPAASVGESISHGLRRAGPAVLALLIFAIPLSIVMVGVLLVIAGPSALEAFAGGAPVRGLLGAIIVVLLIAVAVATRFQMIVPAAAAETGGPVKLLRRSWELTSGHYLRLLAFILVVLGLAVVLLLSSLLVGGILGRIAFGDIKPFTIGALAVALIGAAAQAGLTALASVMLARIYVQLSGRGSGPGVPKSGA
jgi:hypothetical protein